MKKSVAILGALLAASLFSHPSHAEELEIKSTGGASLGKWKYDEIDPTDALLDIELDGRTLISVNAGYVGNDTYKESWRFNNSVLTYDKASPGGHYREAQFNEKDAPGMICGGDVEQNCDIVKSEKASRNLIIVTYRLRQSGAACAGLIYVDEEVYSEGYFGTYGDYYARSISCVPASDGHEEALALSAHYLSLVKKDGRPIARLSRYNLPKPGTITGRSGGAPIEAPKSTAAGDTAQLLSYWRSRSDVVRKAISKADTDLAAGNAVFNEFKIVQAKPSSTSDQLVELQTIYSIEYAGFAEYALSVTIDETVNYHQTVVVDRRDNSVVKVHQATTHKRP